MILLVGQSQLMRQMILSKLEVDSGGFFVGSQDWYNRASQTYIDAIDIGRSQSEQGDHKVNKSVHFVQEKQMLDIQENNNRKMDGSQRVIPREPQLAQPFSPVALKLQQRLKQMQNKGTA